ncbi:hypothetical protein WM31_29320 [Burkholderia ubonensis]|nr:hypothetical protein WM31_29320 [Burkholderia ubonensis]
MDTLQVTSITITGRAQFSFTHMIKMADEPQASAWQMQCGWTESSICIQETTLNLIYLMAIIGFGESLLG